MGLTGAAARAAGRGAAPATVLVAVNFHYVRPAFEAPHPAIFGVTPEGLAAQLELLGRHAAFVGLADVQDAVAGRRALPPRALLVTFDDGLREQHTWAWPVLRRLGVPAAFFVNTRPIETGTILGVHKIQLLRAHVPPGDFRAMVEAAVRARGARVDHAASAAAAREVYPYDPPDAAAVKHVLNFALGPALRDAVADACFAEVFGGRERALSEALYLTREALAELGAAGCLGTHGHDHAPLGLLPAAAAAADVGRSLDLLAGWTGRRPYALSYPYGSREACAPHLGPLLAGLGVELAFTMERAANVELAAPLFLGRFDTNDLPGGKSPVVAVPALFEAPPAATWHRPG